MTAANDSPELEALFDSLVEQPDVSAAQPAPIAKAEIPAAGDSPELEALFDSVIESSKPSTVAPAIKTSAVDSSGDSPELEALFDSVAQVPAIDASVSQAPPPSADATEQERAFNSIGRLARQLHDALLGLGYDKLLEKTVSALPDAKDRLAYVANLTEQAACRVLNATDIAMPLQEQMSARAAALSARWELLYANQLGVAEFKQLADETRAFLASDLPSKVNGINAQLMEIMMAQDFQDLTGQVIKKIVSLAQDMEAQMMSVLIDIMPEMKRTEEVNSLLNGPVVTTEGRAEIVINQQQVDDLLGSLGF